MPFFRNILIAVSAVLIFSTCAYTAKKTSIAGTDIAGIQTQPQPAVTGTSRDSGDAVPDLPVFKLKRGGKMMGAQILLLDCTSLEEVEERIVRLRKAGFNTIIFRVFQNKGDRFYSFAQRGSDRGVYFKTDRAPLVDDILGRIAEITHRNGMEIFAWMTTRYADYGVEDMPGWRAAGYDLKTGNIAAAKGLNLFRKDVRDHLKALYRDLAVYDIDGILFQDDLVLRHTEGFSPEARKEFEAYSGKLPDPGEFYQGLREGKDGKVRVSSYDAGFWVWSRWKSRSLLGLAGELMEEVTTVRPGTRFAINFMYEAVLSPQNGLAWLSQDIEEAVKAGFDYYAIMAYHRQIGEELNLQGEGLEAVMAELAEKSLKITGDPDRTLIKLQIMDWRSEEVLSSGEVLRFAEIVKGMGVTNLAFVPYKEGFDFSSMEGILTLHTQPLAKNVL